MEIKKFRIPYREGDYGKVKAENDNKLHMRIYV